MPSLFVSSKMLINTMYVGCLSCVSTSITQKPPNKDLFNSLAFDIQHWKVNTHTSETCLLKTTPSTLYTFPLRFFLACRCPLCAHHFNTKSNRHVIFCVRVQALFPLLKYVRGEVLSPDHWHELFRMLGLPRGTTLEKLSFGDIIASSEAILRMSRTR